MVIFTVMFWLLLLAYISRVLHRKRTNPRPSKYDKFQVIDAVADISLFITLLYAVMVLMWLGLQIMIWLKAFLS